MAMGSSRDWEQPWWEAPGRRTDADRDSSGLVERHAVGISDAGSAEQVESAPDRQVDAAPADPLDGLEILKRTGAAGVGGGNWRPRSELLDEWFVNAVAEAFHIHGVDEELGTGSGEPGECLGAEADVGELLPTIGHHPVGAVPESATEVKDEPVASDEPGQFVDALPVDDALAEGP